MEVIIEDKDKYVRIAPVGEMDANTSLDVDDKLQECIDKGHFNFHIDFSGLTYISSAGVGVFLSHQDSLENNGGKFVFSNMKDNIFQVFELLGLHLFMKIVLGGEEVEREFA